MQENYKNAWIVCLVASLFFMDEFMRINIFNNLQQDLHKELGISISQYSNLAACYFYGNMIMLFPAGIMLDRMSVKKILITVTLACAFASFIMAHATSYSAAVISRIIIGLGGAFPLLAVFKLATRWFKPNQLALVMGVTVTIAMTGGLIAQTPFILLKHLVGWRETLLIDTAFGVFSALLMFKFVHDKPSGAAPDEQQQFSLTEFLKTVKQAGGNKHTWIAGLAISLLNLPIFIFGAIWGLPYLMQYHALTEVDSSMVVSMMFIGMIIGSPLLGAWSDNYKFAFLGGIKLLPEKSRSQVMLLSGLLLVLLSFVIIFHGPWSFSMLMVIFLLIGFFSSGQVAGYPYISENNKPELAATAGGISSMLIMAGGIVQPFFGWLLEYAGDHKFLKSVVLYSPHDYQLALSIIPIASLIVIFLAAKMAK